MIDKGNIILNGNLSDIKAKYANKNVTIEAKGDLSIISSFPFVDKVENFGNTIGVKVKEESDIQRLLKALTENNIFVNKFNANTISLHEIFVSLAGNEINEEKGGIK
jgi:ABC-2 type transport system ATP-binding protein